MYIPTWDVHFHSCMLFFFFWLIETGTLSTIMLCSLHQQHPWECQVLPYLSQLQAVYHLIFGSKAGVQSTVPATLTSTSHVTTSAGGLRTLGVQQAFAPIGALQLQPAQPVSPQAQPVSPQAQPVLPQAQAPPVPVLRARSLFSLLPQAQQLQPQAQQKSAVSIQELTCQAVDTPVEHL